jgi:TonB-dependent receptor
MNQMPLFFARMSCVAGAVITGLLVTSSMAAAQVQTPPAPTPPAPTPPAPSSPPPAKATPPVETDIGRVTTESGQGENAKEVVPNATIDRADAIAEKQQAPNLIDVQPLSEIIKLPDINTAEALQRIPGISLETDSGEGRFVHIRGLDADLNGTSYGGVRLPASNASSPSGGGRAVAFDTFPTGIIGGIELTKTSRPDMDAEALGGSINLVPRTGAEHGGAPFLDADIGSGYEPLRRTPVYHGEVSAGRSFDGGDGIGGLFSGANAFSAVVSAVYHQDARGVDDIEESYDDDQTHGVPDKVLTNLQFRRYAYHRKRYGVAANFDAKASESTSLYLRLLWSGYLETANKQYLVLNNLNSDDGCPTLPSCIQDPKNPNGFIASSAGLEEDTTDSLERIQNGLGVLGGSSVFSNFKLDYHASFALGTDRVSSSYGSAWTDPNPVPIAYDNNTDPRFPRFQTLDGTNPADPANYTLANIGLGQSYTHDGETAGVLDATIPTGSGDHTAEWKFGLSVRGRHKTSESTSPVFTPNGTISLASATYGSGQVYYNDLYNIGPAISLVSVRNIANGPLGTITDDLPADASGNIDDRENVYAAYGQYSAKFGAIGLLAGLRVESTHATYGGNLYNSDLDTNTPATERNSYTNYFPTLQARYEFLDNLVGRLTYSTGIARPGFEQITPGASISVTNAAVTVGNPALKPTLGQNFDLTLEYYPGDGQIAAAGLFYKQFRDYILLSQQMVAGYPFPGLTGPGIITTVQSFTNGPAHADGIEGQYQQQLKFLPAPFDGLGYSANFTLVDSRAQIHPGIYGLLPSTSKVTWNAALFYERDPIEVRLAAGYVGQNLFAFGGTIGNSADVYSRHRTTLDLGSSYAIAHQIKVYFDAKNLLNTPLEFTEGRSDSRPIQREFYDVTLLAGVRLSF